MQGRELGRTGIVVSPIGLGTVKLGRNTGVKYPSGFELPDDASAAALLGTARDLGVNLIDTAPAYGVSEARLGGLLAGQRDEWVIATKAGESYEDGSSAFDFSRGGVTASVERSLRRLRTDRLDVVLLHLNALEFDSEDVPDGLAALVRLREQGKVVAVGASTKTPEGALRAVEVCDVVMVTLNPAHLDDLPAIGAARDRGVGVLVKKALLSGHVGGAHPADECVRFALGTDGVSSVIVGTINPAHLRENVRAAGGAVG